MKTYRRAMVVLFTFICIFFMATLFVVITKDEWYLFKVSDIVLTVLFFLTVFVLSWTSFQFGKQAERGKTRNRIENVKYPSKERW